MNSPILEPLLYIGISASLSNVEVGTHYGSLMGGLLFITDKILKVEHLVKDSFGKYLISKGYSAQFTEQLAKITHMGVTSLIVGALSTVFVPITFIKATGLMMATHAFKNLIEIVNKSINDHIENDQKLKKETLKDSSKMLKETGNISEGILKKSKALTKNFNELLNPPGAGTAIEPRWGRKKPKTTKTVIEKDGTIHHIPE